MRRKGNEIWMKNFLSKLSSGLSSRRDIKVVKLSEYYNKGNDEGHDKNLYLLLWKRKWKLKFIWSEWLVITSTKKLKTKKFPSPDKKHWLLFSSNIANTRCVKHKTRCCGYKRIWSKMICRIGNFFMKSTDCFCSKVVNSNMKYNGAGYLPCNGYVPCQVIMMMKMKIHLWTCIFHKTD